MSEFREIEIRLKVRLVSVGMADEGLLPRNIKSSDVVRGELGNLLRTYIDKLERACIDARMAKAILGEAMRTSVLIAERSVVERDGSRFIDYVVPGSSIRGVLRFAFDALMINALVWRERSELLIDEGRIRSFIDALQRELRETDILRRVDDALGTYRGRRGRLEDTVRALYLFTVSPYTCTSVHPLSCKLPRPKGETSFAIALNRFLRDHLHRSAFSCVEVGGSLHCVPVTRICLSCALWGCTGFSSLIRFKTFNVHYSDSALITFNRVITSRKLVSPFTIEVLGFRNEVLIHGVAKVENSAAKLNALMNQSYLSLALEKLENYLATCSGSDVHLDALRRVVDALRILRDERDTAKAYARLINALLEYIKRSRLGLGIGRRRSVGLGEVIEYVINEC